MNFPLRPPENSIISHIVLWQDDPNIPRGPDYHRTHDPRQPAPLKASNHMIHGLYAVRVEATRHSAAYASLSSEVKRVMSDRSRLAASAAVAEFGCTRSLFGRRLGCRRWRTRTVWLSLVL